MAMIGYDHNKKTMRFLPVGDSHVLVEFGAAISPEIHAWVIALDRYLTSHPFEGVTEKTPSYRSLLITYDPRRVDVWSLISELERVVKGLCPEVGTADSQIWTIPVRYDGEDLDYIARVHQLTTDEVIRRHAVVTYRVYMIGFSPGFAYLGPLDSVLATPRRPTPRPSIPPRSIAIGGAQTAITCLSTPSGWHLLGQTQFTTFDPTRSRPVVLEVGDFIRFEPI